MRRCPECYETYDHGEKFCEVDGQTLLADPTALNASEEPTSLGAANTANIHFSWLIGFAGVAVGVLLCAAAYGFYAVWTGESTDNDQQDSHTARTQEPIQSTRPAPARIPAPEASLTEEEEATAEAEASPEASTEAADAGESKTVTARLNQGPVSTGAKTKDGEKTSGKIQTIILMKDGTSVEVDAAWEDKQGVWYRRGGLVSFVESQLVKAITARAEPKLSSDESAP